MKDLTELFGVSRKSRRGFLNFYIDIMPLVERNDLCEIGISGSGNQIAWNEYGFKNVVGIDVVDYPNMTYRKNGAPLDEEAAAKWYKKLHTGYSEIYMNYPDRDKIELYYGYSGYVKEDIDSVISQSRSKSFDIVIDDGATGWPTMEPGLDNWKSYIKSNGLYVTETPDGNGTDQWRSVSTEEHLSNYRELAKKGMMVYNMKEYQLEDAKDDINSSSTYIGVWSPNMEHFQEVLKKYEHCRVA